MRTMFYSIALSLIFFSSSAMALSCATDAECATNAAQKCTDLGYQQGKEEGCESYLKCPFDTSYQRCVKHTSKTCTELGYTATNKSSWCQDILTCETDSSLTLCKNHKSCGTLGFQSGITCKENEASLKCPFDTSYQKCIKAENESGTSDCTVLGFTEGKKSWCQKEAVCEDKSGKYYSLCIETDCMDLGYVKDQPWSPTDIVIDNSFVYKSCASSTGKDLYLPSFSCESLGFTLSDKSSWCRYKLVVCPREWDFERQTIKGEYYNNKPLNTSWEEGGIVHTACKGFCETGDILYWAPSPANTPLLTFSLCGAPEDGASLNPRGIVLDAQMKGPGVQVLRILSLKEDSVMTSSLEELEQTASNLGGNLFTPEDVELVKKVKDKIRRSIDDYNSVQDLTYSGALGTMDVLCGYSGDCHYCVNDGTIENINGTTNKYSWKDGKHSCRVRGISTVEINYNNLFDWYELGQ